MHSCAHDACCDSASNMPGWQALCTLMPALPAVRRLQHISSAGMLTNQLNQHVIRLQFDPGHVPSMCGGRTRHGFNCSTGWLCCITKAAHARSLMHELCAKTHSMLRPMKPLDKHCTAMHAVRCPCIAAAAAAGGGWLLQLCFDVYHTLHAWQLADRYAQYPNKHYSTIN